MAFNKAPSQSTYQTKDVKLIYDLECRDSGGTKDTIAINGYWDIVRNRLTQDNDYHFVKRDGTVDYPFVSPSANIRGIHYWRDENKLFIAYDSSIAIVTATSGALITTVTPFATSSGDVGFTEFQYDDGSVKLVAGDGSRLITIDTANTVVTGTSPDQPASFEPHMVYMDGFIFLVKSGTADIYNSNLNDPLAFTSGDFITAEMLPDKLVRIARLNNYMVAFGTSSIEYFWDAANPSGSPLQRNDTPVKQVGYLGGLVSKENRIYFVGYAQRNSPQIFMLEDFKIEDIDSPSLRRYINNYSQYDAVTVSYAGKDFYILNTGNITYQMDMETKLWSRLVYKNVGTFPVKFATNIRLNTDIFGSVVVFNSSATLVNFSATSYRDSGVDFQVVGQTESQNFETLHEKMMSRIIVYADKPTGSSNLTLLWSDDDYQSYSSPRTVNLFYAKPKLDRLGKFVRRSFRYVYADNYPFRIEHFEVDFNIGNR